MVLSRSRACSSRSIAMLMLWSITHACGQTAPAFRATPLLQAAEAITGAAETSPPGSDRRELFSGIPESRPLIKGMPVLPRASQARMGASPSTALPGVPFRVDGTILQASRAAASARSPVTPGFLLRHAARNLSMQDDSPAFILRGTADAKVLAELSIGVQSDIWYTDNVAGSQRRFAEADTIMELRPILQLEMGTRPTGRTADTLSTEYYLRLRYVPTLHALDHAGTSRTLHRVTAEIGRVSPVLKTLLRFEHDENIFGALGSNTVEESTTVTEASPFIEYNLSAKTSIHAEPTWRRIVPQASSTQRSEYILETGMISEMTAKTTLGAGMEFGHILFEQAKFGVQNYQEAYVSMAWRASQSVRFQTRVGVELREFNTPAPKPARVSPVVTAILGWSPDENTQLNAGLLVRNQPSVSQSGATYQEIRFGMDGKRRIAENFYIKGEATLLRRAYDSGAMEIEAIVRPAFGFHNRTSRLFDSVNIEMYYQFKRLDSNRPSSDRQSNLLGIESTLYF